jgi:hypothetical protein
MSDDDFLSLFIAKVEQVAADVQRIKRDHSLSAQVRARDAFSLRDAAYAAECSDETIRRACVRTAGKKNALGFKHEGRWFVEKTPLLDWIERRERRRKKGVSRRTAEERLRHTRPGGLV